MIKLSQKELITLEEQLIQHVNAKLVGWYKNAKRDYGVIGEGKASIKEDRFIIDYVEDGVKKTWEICHHLQYIIDAGFNYYYEVWQEQG